MARINESSTGVDYERELDMVGAVATIGRNEGGGRSVRLDADLASASADAATLHEAFEAALQTLRAKIAQHYARAYTLADSPEVIR